MIIDNIEIVPLSKAKGKTDSMRYRNLEVGQGFVLPDTDVPRWRKKACKAGRQDAAFRVKELSNAINVLVRIA